jgi:hypothetical protein
MLALTQRIEKRRKYKSNFTSKNTNDRLAEEEKGQVPY